MIYLGSAAILILSFSLFRLAAGNLSLTRPHLISIIFYRDFVLMSFIGVVLIATNFDLNNGLYWWGTTGHVHEQARFYGWLSTMYTMLAFPIGMIFANMLFLKKLSTRRILNKYYKKPFVPLFSKKESAVYLVLCVALIVSALAIAYTFFNMKNFPLLQLLKGTDPFVLAQMRADAKIHFSGIAAIKNVLAINFTLLISLTCYGYKLAYGGNRFNFLFYISFSLAFLALTYNLEKAPVFWYFISLFAIRVVFNKGVSIGKALLFSFPLLVFIYIVYAVVTGFDNVTEVFLFRIFVAQSVAIFQGFEYFPNVHDFLGFNGISRLYSFLAGGEVLNSGRILFEIYSPAAIKNNTAGLIVGLFNAETWMLFGFAGVLIIPIYVGFVVQALNIYFLQAKKSPLHVAMYVYFWTKLALAGSVTQFLYPIMIVTILVLFFGVMFGARVLMAAKEA